MQPKADAADACAQGLLDLLLIIVLQLYYDRAGLCKDLPNESEQEGGVPSQNNMDEECLELRGTALTFAVFSGSISSGGAGILAVLTAQNWQPRVHVSPARGLHSEARPFVLMRPLPRLASES